MNDIIFESVDCIVCGENDLQKISEKGQFDIPTNVCICKNCGLSFLSPRWTEEKYLDFYRNDYDRLYRPNVISKNYKRSPEKDPYSYYPIVKRLQNRNLITEKTKIILDIGSGSGQKLEIFKTVKPIESFYAIEPSKHCFEQLKSRSIQVITDDISSDWEQDYQKKFDLITLRHVLEHFMNPLEVLEKLKSTLSPDGIIYIAIPNSLILEGRELFNSYFRVVHTYYFNKFSIKNLIQKAGYEIIAMEEGDELHGLELFLIIKPVEQTVALEFDPSHFDIQFKAYTEKITEEGSISFQVNQFFKNQWKHIVRVKKSFFPKSMI
jgi:Methionine biosynthesis protein MetW.